MKKHLNVVLKKFLFFSIFLKISLDKNKEKTHDLFIREKNSEIKMPDLKGKTMEESDKILTGLGLNPSYTGTGKVSSQAPAAGTSLSPGTVVSLEMKDASEETETPPSENADEKAAQENN